MLENQLNTLFASQISEWELARRNYAELSTVETREFDFDNFAVKLQFNPARIRSATARTDEKSIAERACFLCAENRPQEQKAVIWNDYEILLNPYPIFPQHFTVVYKNHRPQQIFPFFNDLLALSRELSSYAVFYNGARCGASAPDHLHFQAGTKDFLPLFADYKNLKTKELLVKNEKFKIYELKYYLRKVYCFEISLETQITQITQILADFNFDENMLNIICYYENSKNYLFVFPRRAFRPFQYFADDENARLLVSPAAVELGGIIITPRKDDFCKITKRDILSIYKQVS